MDSHVDKIRVIDLSHLILSGMPVFPGTPPVEIISESRLESDGFNELSLRLTTHIGTHLDTPHHLIESGADLNGIAPEQCIGTALVIDCRFVPSGSSLGIGLLKPFEDSIASSDFILLHTGWSRFWGLPAYESGFPVLDDEAARYLASFPLKGIGIDAISFDPVNSSELPVHHILLGKGMVLVENLVNLEHIPSTGVVFSCLPMPIDHGDGSPVRAVAVINLLIC